MEKTKRKSLSKKTRFEIFKRDKFKCQYCGREAPEIVLQVDHIKPVKAGGDDSLVNLITACFDCNMGKKAKLLGCSEEIKKQKKQLDELAEKREQLEAMFEWKKNLEITDDLVVDRLNKKWTKLTKNCELNANGIKILKGLLKKYDPIEIMDCMEVAIDRYYDITEPETVEEAFCKLKGILYNRKLEKENPEEYERTYLSYKMAKAFPFKAAWQYKNIIIDYENRGLLLKEIGEIFKASRNITIFKYSLQEALGGKENA